MSYYYKHQFISPEPLFIKIKEELRSYFDTGAVDDTLFPIYLNYCLNRLGKSMYPVNNVILNLDGFKSSLPEDFYAVREAWVCGVFEEEAQLAGSTYTNIKTTHFKMDASVTDLQCRPCDTCEYPDIIDVYYKTTNSVIFRYKKQFLLTPGSLYASCPNDLYCANFKAASPYSYEVRDKNFVTTIREGQIYLQYYSLGDEEQLIPDKLEIKNYIEYYIKARIFEQLWHQNTDETYNQSRDKFLFYDKKTKEALIIALTEEKKEDIYRQNRAIQRTRNRNNKYRIS